ncbi:PTS fructose transporter subunit IIABC [Candidatus Galacturonibacter soehngenii]|uniref:PTS fructose transporter subunit IIC n=1 Tax=Candidatus Galacturonatibacter soehngenii TaxID=2307010 RepID=A0A7V7QNP1_9FIRM|nr:fructose-specific PTS transporter subunit EIIC [Candidatus Galacturonibacter soehngenii]KAB1440679.1 PTS fructose transporter subunit IIC [Candidatus Galacturonibacter soehngenii]MBA4688223.1 PTS sugar transporter subunit IIA [Candidatus Galacturonibacter soehngenii]
MRITDLLDLKSIDLNGKVNSKEEALNACINLMVASGKIADVQAYKEAVYAREEEGTTGIGEGIAIPHGRCDAVKSPGLAAMVVKNGVDFKALDDAPVQLIFLIAAPNTKDNVHLDVLSKLSILLMDEEFVSKLKKAKSKEEFINIINQAENAKDNTTSNEVAKQNTKGIKLLAVTACPTGIAHTYMAAEAIEKKAKERGCSIKVETRGSGGAKNVLTDEEIAQADCIIVAADTKVPMDRFAGKKVIECQVSDGISKADKIIEKAISGDVAIYTSKGGKQETNSISSSSKAHTIYKHLMSGVSHMLPFVVGGGILIAIAFLIDAFLVDMNALSLEARGGFGSITPYAAFFKDLGGKAFGFMLPVLAGYIAMSIADRPGLALGFVGGAIAAAGSSGFLGALVAGFLAGYTIVLLRNVFDKLPESLDGIKPVLLYPLIGILIVGVIMIFIVEPPVGALNTLMNEGLKNMSGSSKILLGLILGGMMSVDLGGPVNKAAYVFGTASIAAGNYDIMAAVMVGGMVPPTAVALATLLFKNKFTTEERKSGPTNFIMGMAFISEGAIPFAASDPLRVLPSCIIGSAIAGALSMAFNCTLMAPHGGIFVFPVVGNALLYLLALAIGTVVAAFLLGILKKKVVE